MSVPENGKVDVIVRRRRTRRHRRHRIIRRFLLLFVLALFTATLSSYALRYLGPSFLSRLLKAPSLFQTSDSTRDRMAVIDQILSEVQPERPVYPYSVIPGGINDAKELKWVAEHDPIVAAHYAGFDYDHARVVRLTLERTAFVSYRIGNHIYWMRRRITLHKGEKLITDGRMTARGRCANRVEEKPQQEAASNEPAPEKFDQPAQAGAGTGVQSPGVPFESALLNHPLAPGMDPVAAMTAYSPFGGGSFVPFSPAPIPEGVCGPVKKSNGETTSTTGKTKSGSCTTAPISTVPEPSTWIMLFSGLAAIAWHARRKFYRA